MQYKSLLKLILLCLVILFTSCESESERMRRLAIEKEERIELEQQRVQREKEQQEEYRQAQIKLEQKQQQGRIAKEKRLERQREKQAIYNKYVDNSLRTGAKPYGYCFGSKNSCDGYGCSEIIVKTPYNSDVMVTIKKGEEVYRHAYIKRNSSFTFKFPNGTYQPFFYYGKGWNPNKNMKETDCGTLKGGFIADEVFGKDTPQTLNNQILQQNGNFSTRPSNSEEAF